MPSAFVRFLGVLCASATLLSLPGHAVASGHSHSASPKKKQETHASSSKPGPHKKKVEIRRAAPAHEAKSPAAHKKSASKHEAHKERTAKESRRPRGQNAVAPAARPGHRAKGQRKESAPAPSPEVSVKRTAPAAPERTKQVATPLKQPQLQSAAVYVQDDATGKALLQKNADAPRPIASISKLMTAMVALDVRPSLAEKITIADEDVDRVKHSTSRLSVGTTLPRENMLQLALMSSENRAAHALARTYPGGVPAFVVAMNKKAKALGLTATHFEDPTGLSPDNVSSPQDLAKMVVAASRYAPIRQASTSKEATVTVVRGPRTFHNTNPLIRQGKWDILVSKTGYIQEAGRCLVMKAWINSRPTSIVLLDSVHKDTRITDAIAIKRWMEASGPVL